MFSHLQAVQVFWPLGVMISDVGAVDIPTGGLARRA